jgi:hypothetical protein
MNTPLAVRTDSDGTIGAVYSPGLRKTREIGARIDAAANNISQAAAAGGGGYSITAQLSG